MRLKEFIIFIFIFTICYIIFFIVYDKISIILNLKQMKNKAKSLINFDKYLVFAKFYGIDGVSSCDVIFSIFDELSKNKNHSLSYYANLYQISNYDFIVILLYLEYLGLIPRNIISLEEDYFKIPSFSDQNMIQKYFSYFQSKSNFQVISTSLGKNSVNDLVYLDKHFLTPGIRFIDSEVYYVGD